MEENVDMVTRRTSEPPPAAEGLSSETSDSARAAPSRRRAPRTKKSAASAAASQSGRGVAVSPEARHAMIAEAAYLRAERRGFAPGREMEDWLAAEKEIDALLNSGQGSVPQ